MLCAHWIADLNLAIRVFGNDVEMRVFALLSACSSATPVPDYGPIGAGLSVIGLGIVIAAVVLTTLGRWRGKGGDSDE